MPKSFTTLLGKAVKRIAGLRGGGSALPGLLVEKIDPDFVRRTLDQLPRGTVIISGTNGKTTTTKIVVELLESQGLKVFTNRTGSNFSRGVAAALLGEVDRNGKLDADIAILELDEAHGVHFAEVIPPRFTLLLNVMRDQLDRFGEIDTTAKMLARIGAKTTEGIVLNRDDPRLGSPKFSALFSVPVRTFGTHSRLRNLFPSDDTLHSKSTTADPPAENTSDVSLENLSGQKATIKYSDKKIDIELKISGIYNVLNATAALALCRMIMGDELDEKAMIEQLQTVAPAFGRGESFVINGQPLELVLVKNPAGFRLSLASFPPKGFKTMIAINDQYADGRDMSWLWDVDFSSLISGVDTVSGIRAFDMALRLQYDEVPLTHVDTRLTIALSRFISSNPSAPKRIFCTYTAMLAIRRELSKITKVESVS